MPYSCYTSTKLKWVWLRRFKGAGNPSKVTQPSKVRTFVADLLVMAESQVTLVTAETLVTLVMAETLVTGVTLVTGETLVTGV